MATTVKESFRQFASDLNISDRQVRLVSSCRDNVVAKLGDKLSLHTDQSSKLIGSYDRDTIIRYLSEGDVDVMVVLHYGDNKDWDNKDGVTKVLDKFKSILKDTYSDCKIDRNCVTISLSEFRLDVVPAFRFTDGYYTIPDTYREAWLKTDPIKFSNEITRINKNMGGNFIPLIKMVKGWNRKFLKQLRGFHIECMMIQHYKDYVESYTFDSMIKVFFSKLTTYLSLPSYDPITKDRVDLYLDNNSLGNSKESFIIRANIAAKKAKEACDDGDSYPSVAIKEWKEFFGEFFPSYG